MSNLLPKIIPAAGGATPMSSVINPLVTTSASPIPVTSDMLAAVKMLEAIFQEKIDELRKALENGKAQVAQLDSQANAIEYLLESEQNKLNVLLGHLAAFQQLGSGLSKQ